MRSMVKYNYKKEVGQRNVIYCRVSDHGQQADLRKQEDGLKMFALGRGLKAEVVSEIGDGENLSRPLFSKIIDDILKREIATVMVTHRSRLLHSGFEIFENIAKSCGCEIVAVSAES